MPRLDWFAVPVAALTLALALGRDGSPPSAATADQWPAAQLLPHPSQWVVVAQGADYTVPQGGTFVVTGVGTTGQGSVGNSPGSALVDGNLLVRSTLGAPGGWGPSSVSTVPAPLAVQQDSVLSVESSTGDGRLWGYVVRSDDPASSTFELPPPWAWIALVEGTPYVVPDEKLLVMTALNFGVGGTTGACYVEIDGQREVAAYAPAGFSANVARLAIGLVARPGQVVEPRDQDGVPPAAGRAWGFLVDAP
jgi:hypothetical protein